jgi:hypothetical protein
MRIKLILLLCTFIVHFLVIVACSSESEIMLTGYILDVEEEGILLAENISYEKFQEIEGESWQDVAEMQLGLYKISFENDGDFQIGDKVKVWIEGGVMESYPAQANAKKMIVIKE